MAVKMTRLKARFHNETAQLNGQILIAQALIKLFGTEGFSYAYPDKTLFSIAVTVENHYELFGRRRTSG